jgi:PII-like signaling protein
MSEQALKLTTYFGERSRMGERLLADELLDIHARNEIRASILLRGIQGFGAKHRRRTDRLLTLSEDLPLISIAVDTPARIDKLLGDVGTIEHEGLLTLERARVQGTEISPQDLVRNIDQTVKLTVYVGRHERANGAPAFAAICDALHDGGVAGATVLLGVDGTRHGQRRRARFFAGNASVPLMVMAVGDGARIGEALTRVVALLREPLFTLERVRVCKRDGVLLRSPHEAPVLDEHGRELWQKLTIVTSEAAQHEHRPVYLELVRRLRAANAAGATSLRGIWGFHGEHRPHGDRLLAVRRHVPVVTITIDTPERIAALFPIVDELTQKRGLVTSEMVPAASALHSGQDGLLQRLAHPPD